MTTRSLQDAPVAQPRTANITPNVRIARLRARMTYGADLIETAAAELDRGASPADVAQSLRRIADSQRRSSNC